MPAELLAAGDPDAPRRRRRWAVPLVVAVLVVAGVVPQLRQAGRQHAERAAFGRVDVAWAERAAGEDTLTALVGRLNQRATPADGALVATATAALEREYASRLRGLRADIASARGDRDVVAARDAVGSALGDEASALDAAAAGRTPLEPLALVSTPDVGNVDALLAATRERLGAGPPAPARLPLHAADSALARLGRLADAPLPVRLLAENGAGRYVVLDLRDDRVTAGPDLPIATEFLPRSGYVVARDGAAVVAAPLPAGRPLQRLGSFDAAFFPAARDDETWIFGSGRVALFDGAGRRRLGPLPVPAPAVGAVRAGLVLAEPLSVWDPNTRRTVRTVDAELCSNFVAGQGNVVAWLPCDARRDRRLRLTDVTTGRTVRVTGGFGGAPRAVGSSGGFGIGDAPLGSVSPDGRLLALLYLDATTGAPRVAVVDLETGRASGAALLVDPVSRPVWTPDSRRIFFNSLGLLGQQTATLWTYAVASAGATAIRYAMTATTTPVAVLR